MTIKEIEQLSGMTRANIRFYEAEGLLTPERGDNGYRNYSEQDLAVLKRIKLLRSLHVSLDDVKAVHAGEKPLRDALEDHLAELRWQAAETMSCEAVCRAMCEDCADYATLDAQHYLDEMQRELAAAVSGESSPPAVPELESDRAPVVTSWGRRFFARNLDLTLYGILWLAFLQLIMNVNTAAAGNKAVDAIVRVVLMLVLEPVQLMLFGTTFGKWIFGYRVEHVSGRRLTYLEGLERTWGVFRRGMGFLLPIWGWYRMYKCANVCDAAELQEWEQDNVMSQKDNAGWRIAACFGGYVGTFVLTYMVLMLAILPRHQGDITVAEFAENFNRLSDYYQVFEGSDLDEQGQWVKVDAEEGGIVIEIEDLLGTGDMNLLQMEYTTEDGYMTGLHFTVELKDLDEFWGPTYQNEKIVAIMAFVRAQREYFFLVDRVQPVVAYIQENPYGNVYEEICGVKVTSELHPVEGATDIFIMEFTMTK